MKTRKKFPRPIFSTSKDGATCASDLSNEDDIKASALHYLVIPKKEVVRLHDLNTQEQVSIWKYMEELAVKATQVRGINNIIISLNDGFLACQGVGHLHIHIVGFEEKESFNLEEKLDTLLQNFNKEPLNYIDRIIIHCRISELGEKIPQAIKNYLNEGSGFSLFSERLFNDPSEPQDFVLQVFSKEHPRIYSITHLIRVMNGLKQEPIDWTGSNKEAVFDLIEK